MESHEYLKELITSLEIKVSRLEFSILFILVLQFLLFALTMYVLR